MNEAPLRGLIIGCGGRGAWTAEAFVNAGGKLVGIVDPSKELPHLSDALIAPHFRDLDSALKATEADLAMICSPNVVHAEQFLQCVRHGLHAWIEKPIAIGTADAIAMQEAAKLHNRVTMIPFAAAQDPFKRQTIDLFQTGKLGPLVQITLTRINGAGFDAAGGQHYAIQQPGLSGGWLIHHMCHIVDFAMQIGGPVASVFCHCATTVRMPEPNQEEAVSAVLRFRDGGFATLTDTQCGHRMETFAVCGEQGTHVHTHFHDRRTRTAEDVLHESETTIGNRSERRSFDVTQSQALGGDAAELMPKFFAAIRGEKPSPTPIERGVENVVVCEALQRSAATGQPVTL